MNTEQVWYWEENPYWGYWGHWYAFSLEAPLLVDKKPIPLKPDEVIPPEKDQIIFPTSRNWTEEAKNSSNLLAQCFPNC